MIKVKLPNPGFNYLYGIEVYSSYVHLTFKIEYSVYRDYISWFFNGKMYIFIKNKFYELKNNGPPDLLLFGDFVDEWFVPSSSKIEKFKDKIIKLMLFT